MSEPSTPTTGIGINDTKYQPYHELGNLYLDDGIYYLFADIDPDNKINEVHENRHVSSKDSTFADVGGNNMAYFRIAVASSNTPKFDRNMLKRLQLGKFQRHFQTAQRSHILNG